jgi:hypothetical protein
LIFFRFQIKYPNFVHQLLDVFKSNIIPQIHNPNFLTVYGAIKSINILGPTHIINIILPKIDTILNSLISDSGNPITSNIGAFGSSNIFNKENDKSLNPSQNSNLMIVDQPSLGLGNSLPKISFSLPPFITNYPITSSIFSEISNTNVIDVNKESKFKDHEENKMLVSILKSKNVPVNSKKAFYVYYALKVIYFYYNLFLKNYFYVEENF